ncbi:MAG: polysaccharide biosynthesis/export family protein [Pseudomonadota bacterium]
MSVPIAPFRRLAATLAALILLASAALAQSYRIQPGDILEISVLEDESLSRRALVAPDGRVTLPLAGSVTAAGLTVEQVQRRLAAALSSDFAQPPSVFVAIAQLAVETPDEDEAGPTIFVYVLGEVASPGQTEIPQGATLLQALAVAGGPTPFAATRRLQLRRALPGRTGDTVATIDYRAIQNGASLQGLAPLRDGDVILVPERGLFE